MYAVRRSRGRSSAFTLIELLVVIALILVIAAIGIGYAVFGQDNQHSVVGANKVTGALLNAKQRARHDGLPTGIRILFSYITDAKGNIFPTYASQIELIQQPEDYNFGQAVGGDGKTITPLQFDGSTGVDFQGGAQFIGEIDESTVQAGDYFVVDGSQTPHRINKVFLDPVKKDKNGNPYQDLTLDSALGSTIQQGQPYRIIRAPRKLPSEDAIQLPPSIIIDADYWPHWAAYPTLPPAPPPPYSMPLCQNLPFRSLIDYPPSAPYNGALPRTIPAAEIVFSPSGALVGQGTGADKVLLWLHDPQFPPPPKPQVVGSPLFGAPLIVSIQVRTGLISVYPVAPWDPKLAPSATNDPYAFAKDGRASGM
jgi:prepilin-type N-terminal cleavage/methylation domain-containing protein